MGNPRKSACQLRLEARSRAYSARHASAKPAQAPAPAPAAAAACADRSDFGESASSHLSEQALRLEARLARARAHRIQSERKRTARARQRVLHAKRVAREQHAKRREALHQSRCRSFRKLEIARARRREQLERLQQVCKQRLEHVHETVESVRQGQRWREERQRRHLDDQMVDAARRREEQTQRMVRRLSARWQCVEHVKGRIQRVKFIQRWYRRQVEVRRNATSLLQVKRDVAMVVACWTQLEKLPFEKSMQLLQDRSLARAAQHVLRVLLPSASQGALSPQSSPHASPSKATSQQGSRPPASFRVLLMAGMIAFHPDDIMEESPCPRLAFASRFLLNDMQQIQQHLDGYTHATELRSAVSVLEARFAFYFESFSAWKAQDAERLATEICGSYQEIYATKLHYDRQEADHEEDGVHELRHQTEKQLVQLKGALARVLGRDEAEKRVAAVEASFANSQEEESVVDASVEADVLMVDAPLDATHGAQQAQIPSKAVALLQDETLVHHLILDPHFRLPDAADQEDTEVHAQLKATMVSLFWKQMAEKQDRPLLLRQLDELRTLFSEALQAQPSCLEAVNHVFATSRWRSALEATDTFAHVMALSKEIPAFVLRVEAPARNETTRGFEQVLVNEFEQVASSTDPVQSAFHTVVKVVAFAVEKVKELRSDLSNFHMEMLATYLQREGVSYEQKRLKEKLNAGQLVLHTTKQWLGKELRSVVETLSEAETLRLREGDGALYQRVVRSAVMSFVSSLIESDSETYPESLRLDITHLRRLRDAMDRVTIVSSLLVLFSEYLGRQSFTPAPSTVSQLANELMVLLQSNGVSGSHLTAQVTAAAKEHGNGTQSDLELLEQRLKSVFRPGHPVFRLLFQRVTNAIASVVVTNATNADLHASLKPFSSEVHATAQQLHRLVRHHEAVYGAEYNQLLRELIAPLFEGIGSA